MMGPGITSEQLKGFLAPLTDRLEELNITYNSYFGSYDSYTESFSTMFLEAGMGLSYVTRLTPRDVMLNNGSALVESYRSINAIGGQVTGVAINASLATAGFPDNSVHPAWRDALTLTFVTQFWNLTAPWESNIDDLDWLTNAITPKLDEMIPDGATYLNEADFRDPNWKHTFYGENYERLEAIKDKYDPEHIFYGPTVSAHHPWGCCNRTDNSCSNRLLARITGKSSQMVVCAEQSSECGQGRRRASRRWQYYLVNADNMYSHCCKLGIKNLVDALRMGRDPSSSSYRLYALVATW